MNMDAEALEIHTEMFRLIATTSMWVLLVHAIATILEVGWSHFSKRQAFSVRELIHAAASLAGNYFIWSGGLAFGYVTHNWFFTYRVTDIPMNPWTWVLVFVLSDFCFYLTHRIHHSIRFMWTNHAVHHSCTRINYFCFWKDGWTVMFVSGVTPMLLLPWLGFPFYASHIVYATYLFYSCFYHTEIIRRIPVVEWVFITPSHHRVHHGINPEYYNKNFGGVFIIWDKIFGTFADERDDIESIYGLKGEPLDYTYNPFRLQLYELYALLRDMVRAPRWWDKVRAIWAWDVVPGDALPKPSAVSGGATDLRSPGD